MAVPFFVPDGDDQRSNGSSPQTQSTISSATQTPLQSPVNDEHLVQAFYEALSLYSANLLQGMFELFLFCERNKLCETLIYSINNIL